MTYMYLLIAALLIAGWLALFIDSRRMVKRHSAELRLEFQRQMDLLSAKVKALEQTADVRTVAAPGEMEPSAAPSSHVSDEITPETLATISETVAALLGRKVHISSVKMIEMPNAIANPWAQHGRAVVQASRNFASRRREP